MSEKELAGYQTLQSGNDCALHAISGAITLISDEQIQPSELIETTNRLWWHGQFFRVAPGGGVTPGMQKRLVNYLAKKRGLALSAQLIHSTPGALPDLLKNTDQAVLVTIYWLARQAPAIYRGQNDFNFNQNKTFGAHTMLFSRFDPHHKTQEKITPWGFINSWAAGGTDLFWMEDAPFRKAWKFPLPMLGHNATVLITRTN